VEKYGSRYTEGETVKMHSIPSRCMSACSSNNCTAGSILISLIILSNMRLCHVLHVGFLAGTAASARSPTAQFPLEPNTILTPSQFLTLDAIPLLGFGTSDLDPRNASEAVSWAIQAGFRHIDCDPAYKNEDLVGKGIADGLNRTGLKREDLWITSKLQSGQYVSNNLSPTMNPTQQLTSSPTSHTTQKKVTQSLSTTLHDLQISYLDLYHLPYPSTSSHKSRHNKIKDSSLLKTWTYMTSLIPLNLTHHIGLSNFPQPALSTLLNTTTTHQPATHQLASLHPSSPQKDFIAWHETRGIHVTASAPLSASSKNSRRYSSASQLLLETSVLAKIARERGCASPAQVALAWGLRRGTSVLPSSGVKDRIGEFFGALECELMEEDLGRVDALGLVGESGLDGA
jgi:alcohol dehydrogenase (NADP+)